MGRSLWAASRGAALRRPFEILASQSASGALEVSIRPDVRGLAGNSIAGQEQGSTHELFNPLRGLGIERV